VEKGRWHLRQPKPSLAEERPGVSARLGEGVGTVAMFWGVGLEPNGEFDSEEEISACG
jgi:hypothetical protein